MSFRSASLVHSPVARPYAPVLASLPVLLALAAPARAQFGETFKLLPSDGAAGDEFGHSSAITDGVVVVGSPFDDDGGGDSGSAYLFDAATGLQLLKLVASDRQPGDQFGFSVAIGEGKVVVGALRDDDSGADSGSAYVFDATTGVQIAKLLPSDGAAGDEFGYDVAIDGGVVAVGAKRDDDSGQDSGSAYLFDASTGAQLSKIVPSDGIANHNFGEAIDLDGGILAVGARGDADISPFAGAAYLFDVATGTQLFKLLASDGAFFDFFGSAIAIDDGVVAVGAWANSDLGDHSGSAYLFDAGTGAQLAKLLPSDGGHHVHFGVSIDIDAGLVAIGAEWENGGGFSAGAAYVFDASSHAELAKLVASDSQPNDELGFSVATEDGVVVAGAHQDDDQGDSSGSAYVFGEPGGGVGAPFCFGDELGTPCPCSNASTPGAGEGCANSSGAGGRVEASGSDSVSSDDLALDAVQLLASQPALLFVGTSSLNGGDGFVFGDGLRCAGAGVVRLGVDVPDSGGNAHWGPGLAALGGWAAGDMRSFQVWYRDPGGPCGSGFNLSNGLEVVFTP